MAAASTTYRAYNALRGWVDQIDPVAVLAQSFAEKLNEITCVRALGDADEDDARKANDAIRMIAIEADKLITAIILNAEDRDLTASGGWISTPLFEAQEFEVPEPQRQMQAAE